MRIKALECVYELALPDGYIAAGFVRNMVWDHLYRISPPTPLKDIDVIYFNQHQCNCDDDKSYQDELQQLMPAVNWQVKNQARMHIKHGDLPYTSLLDAMRHWPEKETAVGVRMLAPDIFECIAAFGFESLFKGELTHNPKRSRQTFDQRVKEKAWQDTWPFLRIQ